MTRHNLAATVMTHHNVRWLMIHEELPARQLFFIQGGLLAGLLAAFRRAATRTFAQSRESV
jgi:hypothetical protein